MKHIDAGDAGIYGSIIGATTSTGMAAADWITSNATLIGLSLSLLSLMVGIGFKLWDNHRDSKDRERYHKEMLALRISEEEKTRQALIDEIRNNR